jgi:hypothetical protein
MKTSYIIQRDRLEPPERNVELALFTCMLQSPVAREALKSLGIEIPEKFKLIHNTGGDDPPDLFALNCGFECTEFPSNQTPIHTVYDQRGGREMVIPGFSQTGSDIKKIREHVEQPGYNNFYSINDEVCALRDAFLNVIDGPKSKDVYGNDVLLLDFRREDRSDLALEAICRALQQKTPKHICLILAVGWRRREIGDTAPIPNVVVCFLNLSERRRFSC